MSAEAVALETQDLRVLIGQRQVESWPVTILSRCVCDHMSDHNFAVWEACVAPRAQIGVPWCAARTSTLNRAPFQVENVNFSEAVVNDQNCVMSERPFPNHCSSHREAVDMGPIPKAPPYPEVGNTRPLCQTNGQVQRYHQTRDPTPKYS